MIESLITHEKLIPDNFNLIFHDFATMLETRIFYGGGGQSQ